MSTWHVLVVTLLIALNALYVAAEFAAVGARVSRVEKYANEGRRLARALLPILRETRRLDSYIAACQIGITVSSLVLGAFAQATIGLALGNWLFKSMGMEAVGAFVLSAVIVLVLLTSIQVVLGELIPKTVALQFPVRTAMYTYLPMKWSLVVFSPFIKVLNGSGNAILRLFGATHAGGHRHVHSPDEIEMLLSESTDEGSIAEGESDRLRAGLRLARRSARQLMVPRRDIVGLDLGQSPEQMLAVVRSSPYTRLLAYRDNLDEVLGVLHIKDLTAHIARGGSLQEIESLLRPLLSIPSDLSAERVLEQLRERRA
ncbi:MAG: hemolysin family protein, partial [Dokdonella sp.]